MKTRRTRIASLLTALALGLSLLPAAAGAAEGGVTSWSDSIGGSPARIVSVPMGPGRTGQLSLANDSVVSAMNAQAHIDTVNAQEGTRVVAAINGGFFNSYTKGAPSFPGQCPEIMDAVVVNGRLVHTGRSSILGFTAEGRPMVDWVTLRAQARLGNGFTPLIWSVNTYETDPEAIMLFDEHLTLPVTIPASSTMFYIQDGRITQAVPGSTITVPAGTQVLVYNSGIIAVERGFHRLPEAGMTAEITFTASGTDRDAAWEKVETALSGGPVLVKNGRNVVDDSRNDPYYADPKQRPDAALSRSFIGVTGNGSLVMGTVSSTFRKIADWMVANGVVEGLAMDGGASSTLYANGSFITPAGRALASVLTIVDRDAGAAQPSQPAVDLDQPSGWAAPELEAAIGLGLVPQDLQTGYQRNISRQNFCRLIWELIKKQPNYMELLWNKPQVTFSDTDSAEVAWCAQLGIVGGSGDGQFAPHRELSRQEAAKILALTTQLLGVPDNGGQSAFSDRASFAGWAVPFIDYCSSYGILKGDGGRFDPDGKFTTQQAIATILRIQQNYGR